MEDLIAIEVTLADGSSRYFLTWGRIQDAVDPAPVCDLVVRHAADLNPESARVCSALREAAESDAAPYFYDGLFDFAQRGPIPYGDGYEVWRAGRAEAMEAGREIYDCGASA